MSSSSLSMQIANHRENAEIHHGEAACKQKYRQLLKEMSLPRGLLPLDDVVEVGYNRATGFVWLRQKARKEHRFPAIRRTVSYDADVTTFVKDRRFSRLTGVKSKEFLIWVSISDIFVNHSNLSKITFANTAGMSRSFPVSAFELADEGHRKN